LGSQVSICRRRLCELSSFRIDSNGGLNLLAIVKQVVASLIDDLSALGDTRAYCLRVSTKFRYFGSAGCTTDDLVDRVLPTHAHKPSRVSWQTLPSELRVATQRRSVESKSGPTPSLRFSRRSTSETTTSKTIGIGTGSSLLCAILH